MTPVAGAQGTPEGNIAPSQAGSSSAHVLAQIVFAAVVVAGFAAFAITQRLKHTPTTLQGAALLVPSFSPTSAGHIKADRLHFHIDHSDDVTVTVIDSNSHTVARLTYRHHLLAYKRLRLQWNGLTSSGTLAPAGTYHISVELLHEKRTIPFPRSIQLIALGSADGK